MRPIVFPIILALVLVSCGGSSGPSNSPEGTWKSMREAMVAGDVEGLYLLMSPDLQKRVDNEMNNNFVAVLKTRRDSMKESNEAGFEKQRQDARTATFESEQIDGDHCIVIWKAGGRMQRIPMEQIEGKWYLSGVGTKLLYWDW